MRYLIATPDTWNPEESTFQLRFGVEAEDLDSPVEQVFSVPEDLVVFLPHKQDGTLDEDDMEAVHRFLTSSGLNPKQAAISHGPSGVGYVIREEDNMVVFSTPAGAISEDKQFDWRDMLMGYGIGRF